MNLCIKIAKIRSSCKTLEMRKNVTSWREKCIDGPNKSPKTPTIFLTSYNMEILITTGGKISITKPLHDYCNYCKRFDLFIKVLSGKPTLGKVKYPRIKARLRASS